AGFQRVLPGWGPDLVPPAHGDPQCAIAHVGSFSAIAANSFTACAYQNECSAASASLKLCCAAGLQETGKATPLPRPVVASAEPTPSSMRTLATTARQARMTRILIAPFRQS